MITNDRQYRITKAQQRKLADAATSFDAEDVMGRTGSKVLAKAELDALKSESEVLSKQLNEYEALKSGAVTVLEASSLEELPFVLIRARIARNLSQRELAERLGIKEQQIQRYEAEAYSSASMNRLTEIAKALELNIREVAEIGDGTKPTSVGDCSDLDWSMFPVREMYQRGWFGGFTGTLSAAISCAEELVQDFIQTAMPRRQPALLRQRARIGGNTDTYALLAWQCRILMLSCMESGVGKFQRSDLTDAWFRTLSQLSQHKDGPKRAKSYLAESGIPLVLEPHLSRTYLDGAAFLLPDSSPVVGMTLRYDRLDNFWFVLFHELAHIVKHLRKGKTEDIFDDLDEDGDDVELEVDTFAGAMMIPANIWDAALARYVRTPESVQDLAAELSIGPAIIAGKIRKEADNYIILRDLVGQGEVREQFPEVRFG